MNHYDDNEFMELLDNAPIVFGLVQQGKIPLIQTMLAAGDSWDTIATACGWEVETLKRHYSHHACSRLEHFAMTPRPLNGKAFRFEVGDRVTRRDIVRGESEPRDLVGIVVERYASRSVCPSIDVDWQYHELYAVAWDDYETKRGYLPHGIDKAQ